MALLDNGAQINTTMPKFVTDHSFKMGPITDLLGTKVTCMGLGNDLHEASRLHHHLGSGRQSSGL